MLLLFDVPHERRGSGGHGCIVAPSKTARGRRGRQLMLLILLLQLLLFSH